MNRIPHFWVLAGVLSAAASMAATSASAQDSAPQAAEVPESYAVLEELTVTARKREENLQDIPLAVSALSE